MSSHSVLFVQPPVNLADNPPRSAAKAAEDRPDTCPHCGSVEVFIVDVPKAGRVLVCNECVEFGGDHS